MSYTPTVFSHWALRKWEAAHNLLMPNWSSIPNWNVNTVNIIKSLDFVPILCCCFKVNGWSTLFLIIVRINLKMLLHCATFWPCQSLTQKQQKQKMHLNTVQHNNTPWGSKGKCYSIIFVRRSPARDTESLFDPLPATKLLWWPLSNRQHYQHEFRTSCRKTTFNPYQMEDSPKVLYCNIWSRLHNPLMSLKCSWIPYLCDISKPGS